MLGAVCFLVMFALCVVLPLLVVWEGEQERAARLREAEMRHELTMARIRAGEDSQ